MRRKRKQFQHGISWRPRNITDTAWKRHKGGRDIILKVINFILGISKWTMAEKETSTKWNTYSHVCVQFHFPICGPAANKALLNCKKPSTNHLNMCNWVAWSIRILVIYFQTDFICFSYLQLSVCSQVIHTELHPCKFDQQAVQHWDMQLLSCKSLCIV